MIDISVRLPKCMYSQFSAPRAHFYIKVCVTAQKMREGPSEPAYRSRLQTTSSCIGKEPFVVSVEEKAWQRLCQVRIKEMSVSEPLDEASKDYGRGQNWASILGSG